jgi:hypothetical protein
VKNIETVQKNSTVKAFRAFIFLETKLFSFLVSSPAQPTKKTFLVQALVSTITGVRVPPVVSARGIS